MDLHLIPYELIMTLIMPPNSLNLNVHIWKNRLNTADRLSRKIEVYGVVLVKTKKGGMGIIK